MAADNAPEEAFRMLHPLDPVPISASKIAVADRTTP
jgi:hypothetical protein